MPASLKALIAGLESYSIVLNEDNKRTLLEMYCIDNDFARILDEGVKSNTNVIKILLDILVRVNEKKEILSTLRVIEMGKEIERKTVERNEREKAIKKILATDYGFKNIHKLVFVEQEENVYYYTVEFQEGSCKIVFIDQGKVKLGEE